MPSKFVSYSLGLGALIVGIGYGCGGSKSPSSTLGIPLLTPQVKSTIPSGLGGGENGAGSLKHHDRNSNFHSRGLDASNSKSRFFSSRSTNIFNILRRVDNIIQNANGLTGPCASQAPIPYQITPFGQTVTLYAQCSHAQASAFTDDPGIFMYGVKDNLTYVYVARGAERVAAIIEPLDTFGVPIHGGPPIASHYQVEIWFGLGYGNPPSTESYGAVHLFANTVTNVFEMAVAGQGFGYCGAQLKSDGINIFATGSIDMGTTCNSSDTLCVAASDTSTPSTCGSELQTFDLPALGRVASTGPNGKSLGPSQYPGGSNNTISLTGEITDSLWFGPTSVPKGVGRL